jgi:steroid 5-alpha reductase family enzyme
MMQTLTPMMLAAFGWSIAALMMAVLFLIAERRKEADIVDAGWAAGIGILGVVYALLAPGDGLRKLVVGLCVALWSYRLSRYLFVHRVLKPGEDGRYVALRKGWGRNARRNFFIFFQAQAVFDLIFSIPVLVALCNPAPALALTDWLALAVFLIAFGGETLADRQLLAFRQDVANHGKTCRVGLWRYSRHPNYFFEWLHWWSYPLFAFGASWWWLTLVGPAFLLYLLFFVTGIPPTEARALETRGDDYREYQRTTSAFFPWFPKKGTV